MRSTGGRGREWAHGAILAAAAALIFLSRCGGEESPHGPPREAAPVPVAGVEAPLGPRVFPLAAAPALDDPERDLWQRPEQVIAALAIEPGSRVADVGCGTGYFTLRLLAAAGPDGSVIAVDIQQGMLDILRDRLTEADRKRVELRKNAPDRPLAAGDGVALALCANTLNEVDDAEAAAS